MIYKGKTQQEIEQNIRLILDRYGGLMYNAAYNVLNDPEDARDAVQDLLYKMLKNRTVPDADDKNTASILAVSAGNMARDILRGRHIQVVAEYSDVFRDQPKTEMPFYGLEAAIKDLPSDLNEVMVLRYYFELSIPAIAAHLGISVSSVFKRLKKAKKLLKELLEENIND